MYLKWHYTHLGNTYLYIYELSNRCTRDILYKRCIANSKFNQYYIIFNSHMNTFIYFFLCLITNRLFHDVTKWNLTVNIKVIG